MFRHKALHALVTPVLALSFLLSTALAVAAQSGGFEWPGQQTVPDPIALINGATYLGEQQVPVQVGTNPFTGGPLFTTTVSYYWYRAPDGRTFMVPSNGAALYSGIFGYIPNAENLNNLWMHDNVFVIFNTRFKEALQQAGVDPWQNDTLLTGMTYAWFLTNQVTPGALDPNASIWERFLAALPASIGDALRQRFFPYMADLATLFRAFRDSNGHIMTPGMILFYDNPPPDLPPLPRVTPPASGTPANGGGDNGGNNTPTPGTNQTPVPTPATSRTPGPTPPTNQTPVPTRPPVTPPPPPGPRATPVHLTPSSPGESYVKIWFDGSPSVGGNPVQRPVVVGQDRDRRGADVYVEVKSSPDIYFWTEVVPDYDWVCDALSCSWEKVGSVDVDHEEIVPRDVILTPGAWHLDAHLNQASKDWIMGELQKYTGARIYQADWNLIDQANFKILGASRNSEKAQIVRMESTWVQFADPGVYEVAGIFVRKGTSYSPGGNIKNCRVNGRGVSCGAMRTEDETLSHTRDLKVWLLDSTLVQ